MRINSNDEMFGFSVIKLREFFRSIPVKKINEL